METKWRLLITVLAMIAIIAIFFSQNTMLKMSVGLVFVLVTTAINTIDARKNKH